MNGNVRGSVAVVGVAESDLGQCAPNTSPVDLMAQGGVRHENGGHAIQR